jgi:U1 small nuclear ribonucleoprotein
MTQFLPPNLLALFAPRDALPYLPPTDKLTHEKKRIPYSGVAEYLDYFEVGIDAMPTQVHSKWTDFQKFFC